MPVKYKKMGKNSSHSSQSSNSKYNKKNSKTNKGSRSRNAVKLHNMCGGGFINNVTDSIGASRGHPGFTEPKKLSCTTNQMEFGSSCITWFTIIEIGRAHV